MMLQMIRRRGAKLRFWAVLAAGSLPAPALGQSALAQAPASPSQPEPSRSAAEPAKAPAGTLEWGTEPSTSSDTGGKPTRESPKTPASQLPFRNSTFAWDQSASAQTLGVGRDVQTRNPSYDMTLLFRPRYYLHDDGVQNLSLRGEIGLFHEFTNSDLTTERGETSLTDAQLFGALSRIFHERGDFRSEGSLRAPLLTFPTSKVSSRNGTILGLGLSAGVSQVLPLAGSKRAAFQTLTAALRVGYSHTFTRAIVPTNPQLRRVRTDPEGRLLVDDQLAGEALPEHEATVRLMLDLSLAERWTWGSAFSWRPLWKYELPNSQICSVATGCVTPERVEDPQRFAVVTSFETEVAWDALDELTITAGYANLASQVGLDGERRNLFYSPAARFYLTFTANLDVIYLRATGRQAFDGALPSDSRSLTQNTEPGLPRW